MILPSFDPPANWGSPKTLSTKIPRDDTSDLPEIHLSVTSHTFDATLDDTLGDFKSLFSKFIVIECALLWGLLLSFLLSYFIS